jgi:hypothetical protein
MLAISNFLKQLQLCSVLGTNFQHGSEHILLSFFISSATVHYCYCGLVPAFFRTVAQYSEMAVVVFFVKCINFMAQSP